MGARRFQFTVDHMVGRREIELLVTYSMTPGRPETGPTYACGGTPAEPHEVEIISVKHNGQPVQLSEAEEEALWEMAFERAGEDWAEEIAEEMEWRAQQRRDDMLMERWEREQGGDA